MILASGKQLLSIVVCGFALMGFIAVPISDQSAYEHLRDFLASEKAQTAGREISESVDEVRDQIAREFERRESAADQGPTPSSEPLAHRQRQQP